MLERQRALPSWMAKKRKEKVKEKEPPRSSGKRKAARAAFYCMNEKELVEAAVSYLTNEDVVAPRTGHKVGGKAVDTSVKVRANPSSSKTIAKTVTYEDESSDGGDAPETTYVSETDPDVTEVETKSLQRRGPEGQRSGPLQDHSGLVNGGQKAEEEEEEEEDDALQLVRDIFFT